MPARLAQHLVAQGLLPQERVDEAVRLRAVSGGTLDTVLLEQGLISEAGVLQALADVSGYRLVNLADFEPNEEIAPLIPPKIAERMGIVPLSVDDDSLHIACSYPVPMGELNEVGFLLGKRLELWIAIEARIRDWISNIYKAPLPSRYTKVLSMLEPQRGSAPPKADEPIPLENKKQGKAVTRATVPQMHVREETVAVDAPSYAAFARESAKPAAANAVPLGRSEPAVPQSVPTTVKAVPLVNVPARGPGRGVSAERGSATMSAQGAGPSGSTGPSRSSAAANLSSGPRADAGRARSPTVPEFRVEPALADGGPEWSLVQARAALKAVAQDRDQIIDVTLRFARRTFEYAAAFAVVRGAAVGWDAKGGENEERIQAVSFPLDAASVFRTVAVTRGSYVGPLPHDSLNQHYLDQLGRTPRSVFLFPLEVKGRLVALIYGDNGQSPISQRRLADFHLFCQELPATFQELLLRRKQRAAGGGEGLLEGLSFANRAGLGATGGGFGWSPSSSSSMGSLGRAASMPGLAFAEGERPPPDFAPLLRRLTGPDPAARARVMAELARTPEASAEVLARSFPGPTAWTRAPVTELPEADELGPIPAALARLGRSGAKALAPLLDASDSQTRYLALLTAGNMPFAELVDGVLRALFDLEPDISSAARSAATALRRLPRFDTAMRGLRQELAASDPLRRSLAARALGVLHDRDAVDGLIGMTGSDDATCAQAAAEALKEIT
ncbi:MAG: FrgA protein, partial [Myxococcaceae bacterium]